MNKDNKLFADSPWYSVVLSIACYLTVLSVILAFVFFAFYLQFFVIIQNAKTLGLWWIVLTVTHVFFLVCCMAMLLYFRDRREMRFTIGDTFYYMTHGGILRFELRLAQAKRCIRSIMTHSPQDKNERERFLEECVVRRRDYLKHNDR